MALIAGAVQAIAQPAGHKDGRLAKQYAPILWFAPDEPTRPSLPHPFAFDGVDNDCDGRFDLADPNEIAFGDVPMPKGKPPTPPKVDGQGRLKDRDLDNVKRFLASVRDGTEPTPCAGTTTKRQTRSKVLYAVEKLGPSEWVVQYWLYYVLDLGIGPHLHDAEHAFVFLRSDKIPPVDDKSGESPEIAVVVGAGHESHTANNILVTQQHLDPSLLLPRSLPYHMPFRVELGKHAMAPDRNFDGRFDFGMDANIFRDSAWGSRDNQATSQGALTIGPFQSWQSFPSVWRHVALEASFFDKIDPLCKGEKTRLPQPLPIPDSYSTFRADPKLDAIAYQYCVDKTGVYDLVPLADLQELDLVIRAAADLKALGRPSDATAAIVKFLTAHGDCLWPNRRDRPWLPELNLDAMLAWLTPVLSEDALARRDPWRHRDFSDTEEVFKLHLYPTVSLGFGYQIEAGVKSTPRTIAVQLAEVPVRWLPPLRALPIVTKDHRLFTNSTFEISVDPNYRDRYVENLRFIYKNWRGGYGGWYAGFGLRQERLKDLDDLSEDDLFRARTMAIRPEDLTDRLGRKSLHPGVDVGYAFAWTFDAHHGLTIEGRGGIRVEPGRRDVTELERALGAMSRLRFIAGVTVYLGVKPPRDPRKY